MKKLLLLVLLLPTLCFGQITAISGAATSNKGPAPVPPEEPFFSGVSTSQNSTAVTVDYTIVPTENNRPPEIFWAKISGDLMVDSTITALDSAFTSFGNYDPIQIGLSCQDLRYALKDRWIHL